jgi:hypothetical protein
MPPVVDDSLDRSSVSLSTSTIRQAYGRGRSCNRASYLTVADPTQAGRADQAFSLTQHYNESTSENDLWVRMEAFRYKGNAKGWASLGLGPWMTGSLMFILYGDPTSPDSHLTTSVRAARGHFPPTALSAMDSPPPFVPDVEIMKSVFEEYNGGFDHSDMGKPSHVAISEFVVRGYDKWHGVNITADSPSQPFIWSSNFKQDFQGDFSETRAIDMHMFGLGFGFLFIDLKNAFVPSPFFGEIRDTEGHYGINEIDNPDPPTDEELASGEAYISRLGGGATNIPGTSAADSSATGTLESEGKDHPASGTSEDEHNHDEGAPVYASQPFNVRNFLWHIHGVLMIVAFLFLFPLGTYFIRSGRTTAFNYHWTLQALGFVSVAVSAIIGYINSHSISITHQFVGIAIVVALGLQVVLGWRHHVFFVKTEMRRKNWLSPAHMWLGRIVFPVGFVNIFTGMQLRGYGWFTIFLVLVVMVVEVVILVWFIRGANIRNARLDVKGGKAVGGDPALAAAEEEYFQLAGEDDEFSDTDGEAEGAAKKDKDVERREQNKRLAALDKV